VQEAVGQAVRAFEEAGAIVEEVRIGMTRHQQELSDLWCRLIMPANHLALEHFREQGFDLLGQHRHDFPPQYLEWLDRTGAMTALDFYRDQCVRTEIYDVLQHLFAHYDLLVTPTLSCLPVENANDGNTLGPRIVAGQPVDPLIGWCLTYPINFTGHPAASIPADLSTSGLPIGMQRIGRRYADADVLAASAVFERLRPWQPTYQRCATRPL